MVSGTRINGAFVVGRHRSSIWQAARRRSSILLCTTC